MARYHVRGAFFDGTRHWMPHESPPEGIEFAGKPPRQAGILEPIEDKPDPNKTDPNKT